ncbi:MAG: ROK family protein, partial [Actinomycetes bacterium]
MSLAIGVDIGGTKVAAGLVDEAGRIVASERRSTPGHDVAAVEDTIVDVVHSLLGATTEPVVGVGVGAAGFVSADGATVLFSPHLAWRNEPLRDAVQGRIGLPVLVDNDANGAAWAEYRFGAGRGEPRLVCITLGTGIGGGIVMDGRVERGRYGLAGEFGPMVLVPGGHRCECGNRGCWEQYASGRALGREARELAESGSPRAGNLLARVDGDVSALHGPVVTEAAAEGDEVAVEIVEEVGRWLGI